MSLIPSPARVVTDLGEVELQRVVRAEGDAETAGEELRQGVAVVVEEEGVVAEGRHGDGDLGQVVQVLQHRHLDGERV